MTYHYRGRPGRLRSRYSGRQLGLKIGLMEKEALGRHLPELGLHPDEGAFYTRRRRGKLKTPSRYGVTFDNYGTTTPRSQKNSRQRPSGCEKASST